MYSASSSRATLQPGDALPVPPGAKLLRACTTCHSRKVKCDGLRPACGPCTKANKNSTCDVDEAIVWPHSHVKRLDEELVELRERADWLERELELRLRTSLKGVKTGDRLAGSEGDGKGKGAGLGDTETNEMDRIAEEVGMLSMKAGSGNKPYVGSAAGVTFGRILFSPIRALQGDYPELEEAAPSQLATPLRQSSHAGVPPLPTAALYLTAFIHRAHRWYPILHLPTLLATFEELYHPHSSSSHKPLPPLTAFDRFSIFMTLAIGCCEYRSGENANRGEDGGIWEPAEYFNTASTFLEKISSQYNLESLLMSLLVCVYGLRCTNSRGINLWHWAGYAMRLAIELGCSRNHPSWYFESVEKEMRRKIWWTTYYIERLVALRTGRTLSVRNQDIDASWPEVLEEQLPSSKFLLSQGVISYRPACHMFRMSKMYGDILETIYSPRLSGKENVADHLRVVGKLQEELREWTLLVPVHAAQGSAQADALYLASNRATLILNRPSPSSPHPTPEVLDVCLSAARSAIKLSNAMFHNGSLILSWASFCDAFLDGLALLYCSWANAGSALALTTTSDPDIVLVENLLLKITNRLGLNPRHYRVFKSLLSSFAIIFNSSMSTDQIASWEDSQIDALHMDPVAAGMMKQLLEGAQQTMLGAGSGWDGNLGSMEAFLDTDFVNQPQTWQHQG